MNTPRSSATGTRSSAKKTSSSPSRQSGETADTLAAIELAKCKGRDRLGICNVVGSSIARATDARIYTHAGPEIGVASTKAFTAQVAVLTLPCAWNSPRKGTIPAVPDPEDLIARARLTSRQASNRHLP
ncbi:MAG: SIS domain-containing protein [Marinilabiliales bacterium]|nr:SIS domain-containing protein [Marinilabiliales bacterium]